MILTHNAHDSYNADIITLFYNDEINRFIDEEFGTIVNNVTDFINWKIIHIFKRKEDYSLVYGKDNKTLYELVRLERGQGDEDEREPLY